MEVEEKIIDLEKRIQELEEKIKDLKKEEHYPYYDFPDTTSTPYIIR